MSELKNFMARWSRRKRAAAVPQTTTVGSPPPAGVPAAHASRGGCGEGSGVGAVQTGTTTPTPNPSPQGGGEHTRLVDGSSAQPRAGEFDPAQLPPIDSITAESDIRAFLAPGVPAELTRAALRRAWAADPKIRDFVGLAENAWDFNAAGAMPGFGPLEMTEDLRRYIAQLLSHKVAGEDADASPPVPPEAQKERAAIEKSAVSNAVEANACVQPPVPDAEPATSPAPSPQQASQRDEVDVSPQGEPKRRSPTTSSTKKLHGRALPK